MAACETSLIEAGKRAEDSFQQLETLQLPILWGAGNQSVDLTTIVGWLLTAIAISLGAPFWFDALGSSRACEPPASARSGRSPRARPR